MPHPYGDRLTVPLNSLFAALLSDLPAAMTAAEAGRIYARIQAGYLRDNNGIIRWSHDFMRRRSALPSSLESFLPA